MTHRLYRNTFQEATSSATLPSKTPYLRERKSTNINKCPDCPRSGWVARICFVFHSLWGEGAHKQNPSKNPGTLPRNFSLRVFCKDTKEYLNQRGTKISRVFRVCFRPPFLPPFFPHFSHLFPLQALFTLPPLLPSSPPPLSPPFFDPWKTPI